MRRRGGCSVFHDHLIKKIVREQECPQVQGNQRNPGSEVLVRSHEYRPGHARQHNLVPKNIADGGGGTVGCRRCNGGVVHRWPFIQRLRIRCVAGMPSARRCEEVGCLGLQNGCFRSPPGTRSRGLGREKQDGGRVILLSLAMYSSRSSTA